jgi:NTE family protein
MAETGKPKRGRPVVRGRRTTARAVASKPAAEEAAAQQPVAPEPAAKAAAAKRTVIKRTAAKAIAAKTIATKTIATKTIATKTITAETAAPKAPAAKRPVPKKPAASMPAAAKQAAAEPKAETVASAISVHGPVGEAAVKDKPPAPVSPKLKPINLALQGGGAHGAFTWGVLDRLLEDGRIEIEGISGTSAGAMNAAVLASGLAHGGNEGARAALNGYWRDVSRAGRASPLQRTLLDRLMGQWSLNANPAYLAFDMASRFLSPYDFNPLNINPLMDLIAEHVDFEAVQSCAHVHVFVSATNVHTGKVRIFSKHQLTAEAIMASACLPFMFQAVEIDGVPYWDGGYMGNPAMFPFYNAVKTDDILLVQINPIIRRETPRTARDIQDRLNEITFNASLLAQLRAAEFVTRLLGQGNLDRKGDGMAGYRDLRLHRIDGAEKLIALDASTKMNAEWEFLQFLRDIGREAADRFIDEHFDDIGVRSTLDVQEELRKS